MGADIERKTRKGATRGHAPRRIGMIDLDTGEMIEEGIPVLRQPKIKHYAEDYMVMFLKEFEQIVTDNTMKFDEYRVFFFIVSRTQMKNWIQIQQSEIAEILKMKQPNVSRALKKLITKGLIETTTKMGKAKNYRVSIKVGWRGAGKSYTEEKTLRLVKGMRAHTEA